MKTVATVATDTNDINTPTKSSNDPTLSIITPIGNPYPYDPTIMYMQRDLFTKNFKNSEIIFAPQMINPIRSKTASPIISYNPYNPYSPMTTGYYTDLNKDEKTIKTVIKYYYYKIIDKWLFKDLLPLLGYVALSKDSNKPHLIKDLNDYTLDSITKSSNSDIALKADYIENILITKDMVKHVLRKIIDKNNVKWYQLYSYEKDIKKTFYKYIKSKLEKAIENSNNK